MPMWIHALPLLAACPTDHKGQLRAIRPIPGSGSSDLWLGGDYDNGYTVNAPAVLRYRPGTGWTAHHLPYTGAGGHQGVPIQAVAPYTASDIWAVGGNQYGFGSGGDPSALYAYNGTAWSQPLTSTTQDFRGGERTGASAGDVQSTLQVVAGAKGWSWNGTSWTAANPPRPRGTTASAVIAGDAAGGLVWFVGGTVVSGSQVGWADVQIGTPTGPTWVAAYTSTLYAVWANSSSDVWAVGSNASSGLQPEVVHYNGSAWSQVTAPGLPTWGATHAVLHGVHGVSSSDMWVTGVATNGSDFRLYLAHWDGATWAVIEPPAPLNVAAYSEGLAVYAAGTNDVWVTGSWQPLGCPPPPLMLLLHWDGAAWSRVVVPPGPPSQAESVTRVITVVCTPLGGGDASYAITVQFVNSGSVTYTTDVALSLDYDVGGTMWSDSSGTGQSVPPGTTTLTYSTGTIVYDGSSVTWSLITTTTWTTGEVFNDFASDTICGL